MSILSRELSRRSSALAIAVSALCPTAAAAWILLAPVEPLERQPEPDMFETEMEPYDWSAIAAGDWVEYDVATSSPLDASTRVRTRLACVAVEGRTAWVETRDHIVARLFPGAVVLCEVDRSSGRIARAWWGQEGSAGRPLEVRRIPSGSGPPGFDRRGRSECACLAVAGRPIRACRIVLQERSTTTPWSSRSAVWLSPDVPFPRRACVAAADEWVEWEGRPARGGVAREEYSGLAIRMTTAVAGWGHDAAARLRRK